MAKTYPVACECTIVHEVPGTDAGKMFDCSCGQKVEIPRLSLLRKSAGEETLSIDLELEHRLRDNSLPDERDCLSCDLPTDEKVMIEIHCESPFLKSPSSDSDGAVGLIGVLGGAMFHGFAGLLMSMFPKSAPDQDRPREIGKFVAYQLPLRVCPSCWQKTRSSQCKALVLKVPLYRRLIEKYPASRITKIESKK
jgi:hypothetical protein